MPDINFYQCNNCDFAFPPGWGGYMYVENDVGERIPCGHPSEDLIVKRVLGVSYPSGSDPWQALVFKEDKKKSKWWWSKKKKIDYEENIKKDFEKKKTIYDFIRGRTGYNSYCICLDCLNFLILDLGDEPSMWREYYGFKREKDKRVCNKCVSENIKTNIEIIGDACPKCKVGKIVETWTGIMA